SSDDNKGVSSEGPSITSIPKEGPSIARRSKEPTLKELLEWYGYDIVEDYLLVAKKPIPKFIFKSLILIKRCVLGLANNHLVEIQADDHDLLVNSDNENDDMFGYEFEKYSDDEDPDGTNHAEDADGTNHSDLKLRYFDVDLTVKKLVMHRLGKLLRNFRMKIREKYILPNELPVKYNAIVKAEEWVEFVKCTTTDAYKEKSARGKMARSKNIYHHKMGQGRYVFVKEKMDSGFELTGFSDTAYAGCKDTFKSTSGGAQFLGEKLVSWSEIVDSGGIKLPRVVPPIEAALVVEMDIGLYPWDFGVSCRLKRVGKTCDELGSLGGKGKGVQGMYSGLNWDRVNSLRVRQL
nr:hypothetical protein [Tanacetum cinerariifolium]